MSERSGGTKGTAGLAGDSPATSENPADCDAGVGETATNSAALADGGGAGEDAALARSSLWFSLTVAAIVALVLAMAAAAWFGGRWAVGAFVTDNPRTDARNQALDDARQAAINLMSMNPDNVDRSLAEIRSSMTGALLDDQVKNQDELKQYALQSKGRIVAKVEGASLTTLDSERDHASAFVVLDVTRSFPNTPAQSFRQMWTLDMVKVGGTWKAEQARDLGQPVTLDDGAAQAGGPSAGQPAPPAAPTDTPSPATPPQPGG
jgi:Mce-associated membrane protein